jgi:NADH:ubiquinone oxidoreductase subunit 3 (subunit A)
MTDLMADLMTPVITFLVMLAIVVIIYLLAGRLGPAKNPTKYKTKSYYCGEESPPPEEAHQSYDFFHVAFFFTILHVGALIVATAPRGMAAVLALILLGVMALTAFALFVGGKPHV